MKKTLIKLGLVGILALSTNTSAFEVNEKGFSVPDKADFKLVHVFPFVYDTDKDIVGIVKEYKKINGYDSFDEAIINNRTWMYIVSEFDPNNSPEVFMTIIQDKNCDGIFETKYNFGDSNLEEIKSVPDCYKKKPSEK